MLVVAVITYERIRYKEHEIHEIMEDWGRIDWPCLVGTTATVGAFFFIFSHISYWCGGLFGIAGIVGMGVLNRQSTRMLQKLRQGA